MSCYFLSMLWSSPNFLHYLRTKLSRIRLRGASSDGFTSSFLELRIRPHRFGLNRSLCSGFLWILGRTSFSGYSSGCQVVTLFATIKHRSNKSFFSFTPLFLGRTFHNLNNMKLQEVVMPKLFSAFAKISLKELVLVFVLEKRGRMPSPSSLEFLGLADVNTAIVRVQDSVDARFERVRLVVE